MWHPNQQHTFEYRTSGDREQLNGENKLAIQDTEFSVALTRADFVRPEEVISGQDMTLKWMRGKQREVPLR